MTFYCNPKRKAYVLNPRGKPLYEDSSRFGTKMLEKMGWSKGKGLGVNEDGQQNFIKVAHKADSKGIGFEDRDDQWTQHEDQFNSLLKSLDDKSAAVSEEEEDAGLQCRGFGFSEEKPKEITPLTALSGESLEEKSRKSKARVHYKKFTRGKDISRYSERDLANIFGKKGLGEEEPTESPTDQPEEEPEDDMRKFGITTIETGTSISDYFKNKKLDLLKRKSGTVNDATETAETADSEVVSSSSPEKKKKKKRSKEAITNGVEENVQDDDSKVSKKEKKKKNREDPVEQVDETADAESTETSSTKKKRKRKSDKESAEDEGKIEEAISDAETVSQKKKKKKKDKKAQCELVEEQSNDSEVKSEMKSVNIFATILTELTNHKHLIDASSTDQRAQKAVNDLAREPSSPYDVNLQEIYEINRYQAELFRFLDLDGFKSSNLCDLAGYGFSKQMELKVSSRTKDNTKINDLWDYALVNKYGQDVIKAKKKQKYGLKALTKKNLFTGI